MTTKTVSITLERSYQAIYSLILNNKIPPVAKDESGRLQWTREDVERARQALSVDRRRKENRTPQGLVEAVGA